MIKHLFILLSILSISIFVNGQVEKYNFEGTFSTQYLQTPMANNIGGSIQLEIKKAYGYYTLSYNVSLNNIDGTNVLNLKLKGPQLPHKDDGDLDILLPVIKPIATESVYSGSGSAQVSDAASYNLLMIIIPNLQDEKYEKNLYVNVYQYGNGGASNPVSSAKLIYKSSQTPEDPNGGPSTASSSDDVSSSGSSTQTSSTNSETDSVGTSTSSSSSFPTPTDPVVDSEVPKNSSSTNSTSAGSHDPLTDHSSEEKVPASHENSSGNTGSSLQVSIMFLVAALSFVTIFLF